MEEGFSIAVAAADALAPYVRTIRDEKNGWKHGYGGKGCSKLFQDVVFVHKHLIFKHGNLFMGVTSKVDSQEIGEKIKHAHSGMPSCVLGSSVLEEDIVVGAVNFVDELPARVVRTSVEGVLVRSADCTYGVCEFVPSKSVPSSSVHGVCVNADLQDLHDSMQLNEQHMGVVL